MRLQCAGCCVRSPEPASGEKRRSKTQTEKRKRKAKRIRARPVARGELFASERAKVRVASYEQSVGQQAASSNRRSAEARFKGSKREEEKQYY